MSNAVFWFNRREGWSNDVWERIKEFVVWVISVVNEIDGVRLNAVSEGGGKGVKRVEVKQDAITVIGG